MFDTLGSTHRRHHRADHRTTSGAEPDGSGYRREAETKRGFLAPHFKRSESIAHGVQRLLKSELDSALALLSTSDQSLDYRVHEARKCLKRLRALFALVEDKLDEELVASERACIRVAAHSLADLRSAAALKETFDALIDRYPGTLPSVIVDGVQSVLTRPPESSDAAAALNAAIDALGSARDGVRKLDLAGHGWAVIDRGFRRTYARARRYLRRARDSRNVDELHDFRTQQKRHYYQLELLIKVWPKLVRVECRELDRLGERLGEHHDLSLLLPELERRGLNPAEAVDLPLLVERRRKDLEEGILFRGARLFAEAPRARARRYAGYYGAFRSRTKTKSI